jgi:DNA-binding transcriptional ArsR family regulator
MAKLVLQNRAEAATCDVRCINVAKVNKVSRLMGRKEQAANAAVLFGALSDMSRLRVLDALSKEELCVCDIASLLRSSISSVSHHLRVLRNLRLVKTRKDGRIVYYSLADEHIARIVKMGLEHVDEQ